MKSFVLLKSCPSFHHDFWCWFFFICIWNSGKESIGLFYFYLTTASCLTFWDPWRVLEVICVLFRPALISFSWFRTRHEALQKLAIFFQHNQEEFGDISESGGATPTKYSSLIYVSFSLSNVNIQCFKFYLFLNNCQGHELNFIFFNLFSPMESADPPSKFTLSMSLLSHHLCHCHW